MDVTKIQRKADHADSSVQHNRAYIPGGGKEGYYTTWNTKSDQSW
jgi:hypothetical protein